MNFRPITAETLYNFINYKKIENAKLIILHDSGVEANQPAEVIDNYHRNHNKWKGIGYDIYIDKHTAWETFRLYDNVRGAHCKGYNREIGISLSGYSIFSAFQYEQLKMILERILILNPKLVIKYHKELSTNRSDPHKSLTDLIDRDYPIHRILTK